MANILDLIPKIREGRKAKGIEGLWRDYIAIWANGGWEVRNDRDQFISRELTAGMVDNTDWELISPDWKSCTQDEVWDLPEEVFIQTAREEFSWAPVHRGRTELQYTSGTPVIIDRTRQFRWREKE